MHIVHVLNCATVSGPEMLLLPGLVDFPHFKEIWNLSETRLTATENGNSLSKFCKTLNLPVVTFNVASRLDVSALLLMADKIRSLPAMAIIHTHDVKASIYVWLAKILSHQSKIHLVATHHGAMVRPNVVSRLYERFFVLLAKYCADLFLCVSESEYSILKARGIPQSILRLHRNGVERPILRWPERRALEQREVLKLAMVSRLSPEKNHARAIQVLMQFNNIYPSRWHLDILGDGALATELRSQVSTAGLERQVSFRGHIHEAWRELDKYDCLLSFSTGEGLPITMLEAGWRCTPVFASGVGGVPEVLANTECELFNLDESDAAIAQKLAQFSSDGSRLRNAAENLQQRVIEQFSGQRWKAELLQHYHSLVGAAP